MSVEDRRTPRRRLRIACDPCRDRKRKCDGGRPCNMCNGNGYDCSYRSIPRNRRVRTGESQSQTAFTQDTSPSVSARIVSEQQNGRQQSTQLLSLHQRQRQPLQQQQGERAQDKTQSHVESRSPPGYLQSIESNSGAAFARLLTMTLESSHQGASPMRMLAWNLFLGERQAAATLVHVESITAILSELEMQHLASIYMEKFHPCYGFMDKDMLLQSISNVWECGSARGAQQAVLCGVAALACLFSNTQGSATEVQLVALAKHSLDPSNAGSPSLYSATAWLLRTVYLRLTAKPEEAWLASCTTLHIIDASRSMTSAGNGIDSLNQGSGEVHVRRRVFGVAQHLNIWMSYDLGRSRVVLPISETLPACLQPGEYTAELLDLLPYTEHLDPANGLSVDSLISALAEVLDRTHTEPPSVLAQCNLMLCMHRRLYTSKVQVPEEVMDKILGLIQRSIQAVRSAVVAGLPWHHVANIPFQAVCTLLVIDTVQSFALLVETLSCVVAVNDVYQTEATREAATAAYTLLQLHRKRREAEVKKHSDMLSLYPMVDVPVQESLDDVLNGDALQDFWWFNEFVAHSDPTLLGPSLPMPAV